MKKRLFLIIIGAFLIRIALVFYAPALPHEDFADYNELALRIAEGVGFSTPAGPTAFRAPGYPVFLALGYEVFGSFLIVAKLLNVGLGIISILVTYLLARKVFNDQIASVAVVLVAFMPSLVLYTSVLASENLAITLMLLSVYFLIRGYTLQQWADMVFGGIALGCGALTRPGILLLPFGFVVLAFFLRKMSWMKLVGLTTVWGISMAVAILPWTIRNMRVMGEPILISTNGGFNLAIGFNDASNGLYFGGITETTVGSPFDWDTYRVDSGLSESELDKILTKYAVKYIKENPARSALLAFPKLYYFFLDDVSGVYHNIAITHGNTPPWLWKGVRVWAQIYYMAIIGIAFLAVIVLRSRLFRSYPESVFLLVPIVYWTGLHSVYFGGDRFHLPILPFFAMFSAAGLVLFWKSSLMAKISKGFRSQRLKGA